MGRSLLNKRQKTDSIFGTKQENDSYYTCLLREIRLVYFDRTYKTVIATSITISDLKDRKTHYQTSAYRPF